MAETMTKKWVRMPLGPERVEEMERQFNAMSAKGWQLEKVGWLFYHYRRGKANEYEYRTVMESKESRSDQYYKDLAEFGIEDVPRTVLMEMDWKINIHVLRKKADGTPFEIYSDLDSLITQQKQARSGFWWTLVFALLWLTNFLLNEWLSFDICLSYRGWEGVYARYPWWYIPSMLVFLTPVWWIIFVSIRVIMRTTKRLKKLRAERVIQE